MRDTHDVLGDPYDSCAQISTGARSTAYTPVTALMRATALAPVTALTLTNNFGSKTVLALNIPRQEQLNSGN